MIRGTNLAEEEKTARLHSQEEHLRVVQAERSLYNTMTADARATCHDQHLACLQPSTPCSRSMSMHYSFDYAQQVHLPSNPQQPGPIYFLVPRKCAIFGICCEGIPRQVNFLIDEAHLISKGANAVVSYLHYFFQNFGLGETDVHLHCDNCSGQNKNRIVLQYCAWRVAVGLHKSITLNFLIAGHTKFAPDWCFGLVKRAFRRHAVSSLQGMDGISGEWECFSQCASACRHRRWQDDCPHRWLAVASRCILSATTWNQEVSPLQVWTWSVISIISLQIQILFHSVCMSCAFVIT